MSNKRLTGIALIIRERERQKLSKAKGGEGWTLKHDDRHTQGEMAEAAGVYALLSAGHDEDSLFLDYWPYDWKDWFKPKDKISNLVRAGALIVAEIDRLRRKKGAIQ